MGQFSVKISASPGSVLGSTQHLTNRKVPATNNISEREIRPSVIQRKVTNGYRSKWAADAEAALRSTVDTARLSGSNPFKTIHGAVSA